MNVRIRPFTVEDYAALVTINNAVYPEYPETVEEWQHWDEHRDPKCKWSRWMAELDDQVVGLASYEQSASMYHPRKFGISAAVHPEYQGQGVGAALYDHVMAALTPFEPISVRSRTREDQTRSVRFLSTRGFLPGMREWESRLDVTNFDFSSYADVEEQISAHGIVIKTLRELQSDAQHADALGAKLYELEETLALDVPHPEPHTPMSYEFFEENMLKNPNLLPDAYFVAVHGDTYVGSSALWGSQASADDLYTGLTGVRREYRRKGIALALKLRDIAYAREHGTKIIKTWNESNNHAMLSINERLGFVKQPAWITFSKILSEEA